MGRLVPTFLQKANAEEDLGHVANGRLKRRTFPGWSAGLKDTREVFRLRAEENAAAAGERLRCGNDDPERFKVLVVEER